MRFRAYHRYIDMVTVAAANAARAASVVLNGRLKRAFQPPDEPVTVRAIRAQGWQATLKRLLTPNVYGIALRTFIVLALATLTAGCWACVTRPALAADTFTALRRALEGHLQIARTP
jgi:hypothetical protein